MLGLPRSTMDKILREGLIGTITFASRRYITHDQYEEYVRNAMTPARVRAAAPQSFIDKINAALEDAGANQLSEREKELFEALGRVLKK